MAQFEFVADDFGRDSATNGAMIHCHQQGVLSGVALMMGQAATDEAIALAKENPTLDIGWHFHIVDSKPLTIEQWPWQTPAKAGFAIGFSSAAKKLVKAEVAAQWQAFKESGLNCAFVNAHHHMCIHPFIRNTISDEIKNEFTGWMRWGRPSFFGKEQWPYKVLDALLQKPYINKLPFRTSSTLWGIDRTFNMQIDEVLARLEALNASGSDALHEFMFHPRSEDDNDSQCLLALKKRWPLDVTLP